MGAEHSQQRLSSDGHDILNRNPIPSTSAAAAAKRTIKQQKTVDPSPSPIRSRAPSPPLSVCSDLPYVSYTASPIGDNNSPKKAKNVILTRRNTGAKPKRPQTQSSHIVIVKPGARDTDDDIDPDLARLNSLPRFLPILRDSSTSATLPRDPEVLERLNSEHFVNICSRMQTHLNMCATIISTEQNHLVERTKIVSNSITTLFASFVDMQKTYASYAEHFTKVRNISHQLSRCNSLLNENIASIETLNNLLDVEDRLEPFVWCTDSNKLRGKEDNSLATNTTRGAK